MTGRYPRRFGKYVLLKPLAKGGMGEIYLAAGGEIGGFEKLCVIKKVLTEKADKTKANRFLDEAKVVLRLAHSALVTTFDAGEVEGEFYIAMELVEGKDLREVWNRCVRTRQRIPLDVALHVVREVARALAYVHSYGNLKLVHRDVAPPNILLAYVGDVKLTDFGLARSILKQEHTAPGVVFGRAAYLAPEQARGEVADARTDIYTLGIVLWELLTGQQFLQLSGLDPAAALAIVRHPKIAPPSSRAPWISPALDHVVMRALAPEREQRFGSAEEMRQGLSEVIAEIAPRADAARVAEFLRTIYSETQEEERVEREAFLRDEIPKFRSGLGAGERTSLVAAEAALAAVDPDVAAPAVAAAPVVVSAAAPVRFPTPAAPFPATPQARFLTPRGMPAVPAPEAPSSMIATEPSIPLPVPVSRPRTGRTWEAPRLPGLPPTVGPGRVEGASRGAPAVDQGPSERPLGTNAPAPPAARVPAVIPTVGPPVSPAVTPPPRTSGRPTPHGVPARVPAEASRPNAAPTPTLAPAPSDARIIAGRYRIGATLGEGNLGTLFRVTHIDENRDLALRLLAPGRGLTPEQMDRWRREARTVSSLRHPHAVEIYDLAVTDDGQPYVVMEPVMGVDLATFLAREQRLDPGLALQIATPLCQIVGAAHAAGVVHGAIRPESIYLVPRGKSVEDVKLLDFGLYGALAKDATRKRITPSAVPAGVVEYFAPEQIAGRPADTLCDVYGVGAVLYELLTGVPPHAGTIDLVGRRSQQPPQSPRLFRPDLPEELERVTMAALERDRDLRPNSIAALQTALHEITTQGARASEDNAPEAAGSGLAKGTDGRDRRRATRDAAYRAIAELSAEPGPGGQGLFDPTPQPEIQDPDDNVDTEPKIQTLPPGHVSAGAPGTRSSAAAPSIMSSMSSPGSSAIPARVLGGGVLARYGVGSPADARQHKRRGLVKIAVGVVVLVAAGLLITGGFSSRPKSPGQGAAVSGAARP